MRRRDWLKQVWGLGPAGALLPLAGGAAPAHAATPPPHLPPLRFPADHGAHPQSRIEWWYLTGWLAEPGALSGNGAQTEPGWGFQVTFFRSRTGLAESLPGRFAPRQLLFAHAALTVLGPHPQHQHDQRLGRWDGRSGPVRDHAGLANADLALAGWRLSATEPDAQAWTTQVKAQGFALALTLRPTQPLLLQGEQGYSRKGPEPGQASRYVTWPQLAVAGTVAASGEAARRVAGTAWLDHEWSDQILPPQAQGWDWLGINLFDGGALTAFQLRRREGGGVVWAGGSFRAAAGRLQVFGPQDLSFEPEALWHSPATGARYPTRWRVRTPVGVFVVRALLPNQELDSRASTGTVYWEGLSELLGPAGQRLGLGYLEMTGYADRPPL